MFGRASRSRSTAPPEAGNELGYHPATVLVADPDTAAIGRVSALFAFRAQTLQGHSGETRGYDRGDPGHSFNGVVDAAPRNPIPASAKLGLRDQALIGPAEYTDTPSIDLSQPQASYMASLFQRIGR